MSAVRQVRYLFTSTDGREIEIRGFIVRESTFSSNAPVRYNATFKMLSIIDRLPPPIKEGATTDENDLVNYAKAYGFTLTRTDSDGGSATLNTALVKIEITELHNYESGIAILGTITPPANNPIFNSVFMSEEVDSNFVKITDMSNGIDFSPGDGYNISAGKKYFLKARSVKADGSTGAFSNVMSILVVDNS